MKALVLFFVFLCVFFTCGEDFRKEMGYPFGYLSYCPGSEKPATISRSQLKYLGFVRQGSNVINRKRYSYHNVKLLVKDPEIDFKKKKTVLIVSGYVDNPYNVFATMASSPYYDRGYNVLILDYLRFSSVHYQMSSRLTRPVGKHVAEMLVQLLDVGLKPAHLELVGFSLGAHVVGYVGKNFQQLTGRNFSRITALEPPGPCFRYLPPHDILQPSDAEYVEAIHTNIDVYGMPQTLGQVDFYVNGGEYQPSDINLYACDHLCSHLIVASYWQQAIYHPKKFIGVKCDNVQQARDNACFDRQPMETNYLGVEVNKTRKGIFYIATDKYFPFYLGEEGLKKENVVWRKLADMIDFNRTEIRA